MNIELTKQFEGLSLTAYPDPGTKKAPWTIGYGHTGSVKEGDTCTQEQADAWLINDLQYSLRIVQNNVKVDLTENQESALVDLTYNIGAGNFVTSTLLKKLNSEDYAGAALEFSRWNKAGGKVMSGLTRRRSAEALLFTSNSKESS